MVETLRTYFAAYEREGVVTLELTDQGLWLVNPHDDSRQFLGQAVLPADDRGPPRSGRREKWGFH